MDSGAKATSPDITLKELYDRFLLARGNGAVSKPHFDNYRLRGKQFGDHFGWSVRIGDIHAADVWTWDFIADATVHGGALRMLTVLDEHTKEVHVLRPERRIGSADVIAFVRAARRCSARLIGSFRELPIAGLVDASTDSTDTIRHALGEVMEGRHFWTAAVGDYLRDRTLGLLSGNTNAPLKSDGYAAVIPAGNSTGRLLRRK